MIYYVFLFLILILGLLNPVRGNNLDAVVGYFLFCLVVVNVFLPKKFIKFRKYAVWVVILSFLVSSFATSFTLRAMLGRGLPLYTYNNDEGAFLKTYKMMKGNIGYYDAYRIAFTGKFTGPAVPGDVWGWRMPTIFEIWKIIPGNGVGIYFLYLILASAMIYGAYSVGKRYLGGQYALLPAYLVFPYLHFAARDQILLLTEWWSVPFFFIGLYLYVVRRYFLSILLLALAVLIREVYVLPLFLICGYFALKLDKKAFVFLIPIVAFFALFLYHVVSLMPYIDAWHMLFLTRPLSSGTLFVQQTLAFGSWEYRFYMLRPFIIFLPLVLAACFYIYRTKS